jgi:putative hydrolase of the HAD superfamily
MIKAIIFDFNGVFVEPVEKFVIKKICKKYKINFNLAIMHYFLNLKKFEEGKILPNGFWERVFPGKSFDEISPIIEREYLSCKLNQKNMAIALKLSKKHQIYCLSNSNELQAKLFKKKGFYSIFSKTFLSHELGSIKPFPSTYKKVISMVKLKPKECIFIDDSLANILAAKILGFKTILLRKNISLEKQIGAILKKEIS